MKADPVLFKRQAAGNCEASITKQRRLWLAVNQSLKTHSWNEYEILCRATFVRPRETRNAGLNRRMIDHRVMNLSELVPNLPETIPTSGLDCAATVVTSDGLFPTLPNTHALRSNSRSMYDGSRPQPAIVAPPRGSSENEQGTHLLSFPAASCSERDMCRTSFQTADAITGVLDNIECTGHPALIVLTATWTTSCFNASAFQPAFQSHLTQTSACCFGIGWNSEKGTGHNAD